MIKRSLLTYRGIITILLVIVFFVIVAVIIFHKDEPVSIKKYDVANENTDSTSKNKVASKDVAASNVLAGENSSSLNKPKNSSTVWVDSEEQKHELEMWALSRGKVSLPLQNDAYDSYDKATLEALAKNNHDVKAMIVLGLTIPGEEGKKWFNMAAIYGSSFALAMTGVFSAGIHKTESEEIKKSALIDSLAYKKVAELRNDYYSAKLVSMSLYESKLGLVLSDQDKEIAEKKSHALYEELEAQRMQLGLGRFDNTVPAVIDAYYTSTMPYYH